MRIVKYSIGKPDAFVVRGEEVILICTHEGLSIREKDGSERYTSYKREYPDHVMIEDLIEAIE